jgi:hypothetical protein
LLLEAKDLFKLVGFAHNGFVYYREKLVKNHCFFDISTPVVCLP